jgi:hypothetical protein
VRRAIDFAQGTAIDEAALRTLVLAAVNLNRATGTATGRRKGAA